MADFNFICRSIYHAVYISRMQHITGAPVAYIHIKTGNNPAISLSDLAKEFDKVKWNTPLSTADLSFTKDSSIADNQLEIEMVEEFQDDEGNAEKHEVHPEDKIVAIK